MIILKKTKKSTASFAVKRKLTKTQVIISNCLIHNEMNRLLLFTVRTALNILNILYFFFKKAAVRDRIAFISRETDEKSVDFEILENDLRKACPETELVFLCRKIPKSLIGRLGYGLHLLRQMRVISTSRAVILDGYCFGVCALKQRDELMVIQIWHAMGTFKKFGWSIVGKEEGRNAEIAALLGMHRNYTYYTVSSEECITAADEAFGYNKGGPNYDGRQHAIVEPLPRMRRYSDAQYIADARKRVLERYPEWKNETVVVYVPTFRTGVDISDEILKMKEALPECRFVVKEHPLMKISCDGVTKDQDFSSYEIMCAADYIIIDYSAIVFEAVFLNKPLIFYPFDIERYLKTRGLYFDYRREMPGTVAKGPEDLAEVIRTASFDCEKVRLFRKKWINMSTAGKNQIVELLRNGQRGEQNNEAEEKENRTL